MKSNFEIAKIFREMAFLLEMEGVAFKPQAYEKAAEEIEDLNESLEDIYKNKGLAGLMDIPGIGKNIAIHIEEYLKTGKIKNYSELIKKNPINVGELLGIEGLGPKKIKALYQKLKIKNLNDLEKAAQQGKIRVLPQFGEKTEKNILEGLEFFKKSQGRFLISDILPTAERVIDRLKKLKEVEDISFAGSLRRHKDTIGDADILVAIANNSAAAGARKVFDYFLSEFKSSIVKVWAKGGTKVSVRMSAGFDIDIRILSVKNFGAGLQYFTGSKEHNIALRKIAITKGLKLNEYGLFKGEEIIAGRTEEEIYGKLGLRWIPPELRENTGEIEAARKNNLKDNSPKLIELKDIKGDLHVHSYWGIDHSKNSIENLVKEAKGLGYQYIGISDHTKFLAIEHGLDEKQLMARNKEIDKLNLKDKKFRILKGCETNIMADGSIDISDAILAEMDYVIAGVHSQMKMPKNIMTQRIIKAMENPHVDIISHPTGRILKSRGEYEIDFDAILAAAKKTGTILEINAHPVRLDLNDINIKKAKKAGVKMIINSDAHNPNQLKLMEYGVYQARRGWAEKGDIINAWPAEKFMKNF